MDDNSVMQIITKWKNQDEISSSGLEYHEPILAQRLTLFESDIHIKSKLQDQLPNGLEQMHLDLMTECREAEDFDLAKTYSARLQKIILSKPALSKEFLAKVHLENAQLYWDNDEVDNAEYFIELVIDSKIPSFTLSKGLCMMGELRAKSGLKRTKVIAKDYLSKSIHK